MLGERDGIRDRRGAGSHHQAVERQACRLVGAHHRLALVKRERGRLAGGAEHIEAVAAVVEEIARQIGCALEIGRAGLVDRGGNGGDHAAKGLAQ